MRSLMVLSVATSLLVSQMCQADTRTNDEVFANAALRNLHSLAVATAKLAEAAKDGDNLGCRDANGRIEETAHGALENMHYMSFSPIDGIRSVSTLLRLNHIAQKDSCPADSNVNLQWLTAGQAVMALRWDYAVGNYDWYLVTENGDVRKENPLRYNQSLSDQYNSWISIRPKGMTLLIEPDWKSEMASSRVDDASIENSGSNLQAVEEDYRKNPGDEVTSIYFYRGKSDALTAVEERKKQADDDAEQKAADTEWKQKLLALPYISVSRDPGFKLIYSVCKVAHKNVQGDAACINDDSHDWSDDRHVEYRWFSDLQSCELAERDIAAQHPPALKFNADDTFVSDCVPASKPLEHSLRGYVIVVAMTQSSSSDPVYAVFRERTSADALLFKAFSACYDEIDSIYLMLEKDLNIDKNGDVIGNKNKGVGLVANCVRVY